MDICMHVRTSCQTVYPVANTTKKLYKRTKRRLRTIEEVEEEYFPGFKALLTLQNKRSQGQRTKERRRKSYYSGKKKKETYYYQDTIYYGRR
jgi:hypothetical protein